MPDNYGPIETVHKVQYANNVALALQDKGSRFMNAFTPIVKVSGKELQAVELVGASDAIVDDAETSETPDIAPKHIGVWCRPRRLSWGRVIREGEQIKTAVDYTSIYVQEGAAAVARGRDDVMASCFFNDRLVSTDETGVPAAVGFDTANRRVAVNFGAGGNVGFTFKKFIRGLEMLGMSDVDIDMEDIYCVVSMKQNSDMYNEVQFVSQDYRNRAVIDTDSKTIRSFMGVNFITFNRLPTVSNHRAVPMFAKSGLHYGTAIELRTQIERNPNRQYRAHPFMETYFAATRSEDEKMVQILCAES